ncbi:PAS domain-containing protein [Lentzea sp. E54]|uniref:PAS domain-containing protein n=1 Tax=Lentzea xerophila TaxID=3435883 RepID=UPI003DA268A4
MDRSRPTDERVLATVVRASPFPAFLREATGRYLWVNAAFAALHGIASPAEMLGKRTWELSPADVAEEQAAADRAARRSGHALPHSLTVEWDGRRFVLPGHVFRVAMPDGEVVVGGMYVDTAAARVRTPKTGNTAPAQEPEVTTAAPWRAASAAIAIVDDDAVVVDANEAWLALLGREADEVLGQPLGRLLHGSHPASNPSLLDHSRSNRPLDAQLVHQAGTLVPVELHIVNATPERYVVCASQVGPATSSPHALTEQQASVLELLAVGSDNAQLAKRMGLSRQGLDYHIRQLRAEMAAASRAEIVARAYFHGVLDVRTWPPRVRPRHVRG